MKQQLATKSLTKNQNYEKKIADVRSLRKLTGISCLDYSFNIRDALRKRLVEKVKSVGKICKEKYTFRTPDGSLAFTPDTIDWGDTVFSITDRTLPATSSNAFLIVEAQLKLHLDQFTTEQRDKLVQIIQNPDVLPSIGNCLAIYKTYN